MLSRRMSNHARTRFRRRSRPFIRRIRSNDIAVDAIDDQQR